MIVHFLFLALASWILGSILYWSLKNGITPTMTSNKARRQLLNHLPPVGLGKIVELGFGWGTMAFALADKFPDHQVVAFETSFFPFLYAQLHQFLAPRSNLSLCRQDFFAVPLADATLIYCYLYPLAMQKLKPKFEAELPSGCMVISHTFAIPNWQPTAILYLEDLYHNKIYFYTKASHKPPIKSANCGN